MTKDYNLKNIRILLIEGFTPEEIRRFCHETPEFRPVHDQLAEDTGKAKIIDLLLEYAEQKVKVELILIWAKEQNPVRYVEHGPYNSIVTSQGSLSDIHKSPQCLCFFAYSIVPASLGETIELGINQINIGGSGAVTVQSWKSLGTVGKITIEEILTAIDICNLFICDLTNLDTNVLFQLGYAIAKDKPVWITLDSSDPYAEKNYKKLGLLASVNYTSYQNSYQLNQRFFTDEPYKNLSSTIYRDVIQSIVEIQNRPPALVYLKSEINTDSSIQLTRRLQDSRIPLVTDDPQEISSQPLSWYTQNGYNSYGVVVHLIDERREIDSSTPQNAKYSLVSGMIYGFGKPLLMLAHAPFNLPVVYGDLLQVHETAAQCSNTIDIWLPLITQNYLANREQYKAREAKLKTVFGLQKINLGQYTAENEKEELSNYFVATAAYKEALKTMQYTIFVGRKGSGKTANLYQIAGELPKDKRNHVCVIKPVDYELEGVLHLLKSNISKVDTGYLIESLWKFLIYTELAFSVYEELRSKPSHYDYSDVEREYLNYLEENKSLVLAEFTIRMEHAINELCQVDSYPHIGNQRAKVSEILHRKLLGDLRKYLGRLLEKKNKVFVLVDNLDKAWKQRDDLDLLSGFLFGLLSAGQAISNEFQKDLLRRPGINLSLLVFLRSDIFSHIMRVAREGDKIAAARMDWNDPLLLQRVIEERFISSLEETIEPEEIWQDFFDPTVKGKPTKEYIVSRIIPRPRDIIYLCTHALSHAINHKHSRIEEGDLLRAEKEYSEYAFNSLRTETEAQLSKIEELLYEFVGTNEIIAREQIERCLKKVEISEDKIDYVIELLSESTFLGLETYPNTFMFLYEGGGKNKVLKKLAQKTAEQLGEERFRINVPFHAYLEINPTGEDL